MPITIEERKADIQYLINEINKLDQKMNELPDLTERNNLVGLLWNQLEKLPTQYEPGQYVLLKLKRKFKGKVISIIDPKMHHYEIQPIDNVYKEKIIVSHTLIEPWTEEMENGNR